MNFLLEILKKLCYNKLENKKKGNDTMANEKLIAQYMVALGISREEAIQVIADDEAIDHGAKLFELTPEQEKESKKARQADRKPIVYNFDTSKRKRAENPDKRFLIDSFSDLLETLDETDVEITNPEREIVFHYKGTKYKLVLSAPRS